MSNDQQGKSENPQVLSDTCADASAVVEVYVEGLCSPFTEKDPLLEELSPHTPLRLYPHAPLPHREEHGGSLQTLQTRHCFQGPADALQISV
jgi:hypothetical protein